MRIRSSIAFGSLAALVALAAGWATLYGAAPRVSITDFRFSPASVTVVAGDVVTWQNTSTTQHTVTADDGSFDSGPLGLNDQFANVFDVPGTYTYHCSIHPAMTGTIVVEAAPPTPTPAGTPAPTPPAGTLPPDFKTPVPVPTAVPSSAAPSTAMATPTDGASESPEAGSGGSDTNPASAQIDPPVAVGAVALLALLLLAVLAAGRGRARR